MKKPKFDRVIVAVHPRDVRGYRKHDFIGRKIAWTKRRVWSTFHAHKDINGYEHGSAFVKGNPRELYWYAISTKKI